MAIEQFYTSSGLGDFGYLDLTPGDYYFWVRAHNDCGWSDWDATVVEIADCDEMESMYYLEISPNPASEETNLILKSNSEKELIDESQEWSIEVYSQSQLLKEKKPKIKGKEYKLKIHGWKEGIYIVRVNYKDNILTEKLIIK